MVAPGQLQIYADTINAKGAPLDSCFGVVDGTVRRIARPKNNQPKYTMDRREYTL